MPFFERKHMDYLIGIDLGTTATKAVLFDQSGIQIATSSQSYPLYRDAQGMAEEDLEEIFTAMISVVEKITRQIKTGDSILACSFSTQMHALIAFDQEWQPLTRVLTWADTRAEKYSNDLKSEDTSNAIYHKTGTPLHPMSPLAKLLWLKNERKEIFKNAAHFMDLKGAIFQRIFQSNTMDLSIATGTGFFNNQKMTWDDDILDLLGISKTQLPKIVSPYAIEKGLPEKWIRKMGLSPDTVFVYGAGDGPMSNLGVGAIKKGELAITVGTSGALRMVSDVPQLDEAARTFSYALDEDHWVNGGAVNSGGDVFRWLKDNVLEKSYDFAAITDLARGVSPGSDGLIFHPYLGGERAPLWNAAARASFFGLSYRHTTSHMARAVLEGISFNLRMLEETLTENSACPTSIKVTGGFSQSELWLQILADIFELPITVQKDHEAGCFAAQIMAQKALGRIDSIEGVASGTIETVYKPQPENFKYYRALYPLFKNLTEEFAKSYAEIAKYQQEFS